METTLSSFWVGVSSSLAAMLLLWLTNALWSQASLATNTKLAKRITRNRRNLTAIIVSVSVLVFSATVYILGDRLSKTGLTSISIVCIVTIGWHLVSELNAFWSIGFNYIDQSVSSTTYRDAFEESCTELVILGTNAYNLSKIDTLETTIKRIRESRGHIRMILAHPDSEGLKEAARSRGKSEHIYRDQAMYSLGMILEMGRRIGANVDIKLYSANNIEELPIFRIMLINSTQAVASISVYGRDDHGRSLPQFYAYKMGNKKSHKSMYSVLSRYVSYFYDKSSNLAPLYCDQLISYWNECRISPQLMNQLEG